MRTNVMRLKSGKVITAWALEGDLDVTSVRSNTFETEWPPRSGRRQEFPEVDRAEWFEPDEARRRLNPAQAIFVDRLDQYLDGVDRQTIEAWSKSRPRAMLLASIRSDHRRAVEDPEHPASQNASHVLVDDWLVPLDADLSGTSRAQAIADYKSRDAARLGPFLGGSTQVLGFFEKARRHHHLAFALVMAAIEAVKLACPLHMKQAMNKPEIVVSLPIVYSLAN